MSRSTICEYLQELQPRYSMTKSRLEKRIILDEFCKTTRFERKYAIKLLTGNRTYRTRKGRGKTYGQKEKTLLVKAWRATGCMCSIYLKARIKTILSDLKDHLNFSNELAKRICSMSASTMERILKNETREKLGIKGRQKRRPKSEKLDFVKEVPSDGWLGQDLELGHLQVDTVSLCGGDPSGNYFWILSLTDIKSGIFEFRPIWNRGSAGVFDALEKMLPLFPFPIKSLHYDNGREFMNDHLVRFAKLHPEIKYQRSRVRRSNDNSYVEEDNRSAVRAFLGYKRYDNPNLMTDLWRACEGYSDYHNYCLPRRSVIKRIKWKNRPGYKRIYDTPKTPIERVLKDNSLTRRIRRRINCRTKQINSVTAYQVLDYRIRRIHRKQRENIDGALPHTPQPSHTQPLPLTPQ